MFNYLKKFINFVILNVRNTLNILIVLKEEIVIFCIEFN